MPDSTRSVPDGRVYLRHSGVRRIVAHPATADGGQAAGVPAAPRGRGGRSIEVVSLGDAGGKDRHRQPAGLCACGFWLA